jgi:hypothetical protein
MCQIAYTTFSRYPESDFDPFPNMMEAEVGSDASVSSLTFDSVFSPILQLFASLGPVQIWPTFTSYKLSPSRKLSIRALKYAKVLHVPRSTYFNTLSSHKLISAGKILIDIEYQCERNTVYPGPHSGTHSPPTSLVLWGKYQLLNRKMKSRDIPGST